MWPATAIHKRKQRRRDGRLHRLSSWPISTASTNAVAVLGTALGERHLQLLRRFTDSIALVLDGDEAGRRRTNEISMHC